MLITPGYVEQNRQLHQIRDDYGSKVRPKRIEAVLEWKKKLGAKSVLDYGCGKGILSKHIAGITNYDPAIAEFSAHPKPADLVVCMDVLEHVEPECLDNVLDDLMGLASIGVLFIIGTRPEMNKVLPDGRSPHLIVEPAEWWLPKLRVRWGIVDGWFTAGDLCVRAVAYAP